MERFDLVTDEVCIFFVSQPKTKCEPHALMHGDEVKMGDTVLSFHIHSGTDTCDGCEPGQVMAHLSKHRREEKTGEGAQIQLSSGQFDFGLQLNSAVCLSVCPSSSGPAPSKEDKEALRQKELKQMKAKYGLQVSVTGCRPAASTGWDPSALHAASHVCASVCAEQ